MQRSGEVRTLVVSAGNSYPETDHLKVLFSVGIIRFFFSDNIQKIDNFSLLIYSTRGPKGPLKVFWASPPSLVLLCPCPKHHGRHRRRPPDQPEGISQGA